MILPQDGPAFIETLPVQKFHGIGPKTAEKMKSLGIHTGADLRAQSLMFLHQHFGRSGDWYYEISRGQDDREVETERIRKSSGSETTFSEDLRDPERIEAGVIEMADYVWQWCEQETMFGRTVTVKIKFADFKQITRSRSHPWPVMTKEDLRATSLDLIRSIYPVRTGIRLVGVTMSNFDESAEEKAQLDLGLVVEG